MLEIKPLNYLSIYLDRLIKGRLWLKVIIGLVLGAGLDLVKANAIKVLIVLLYTPFALGIFMYHKQVDYSLGLILAVGNMLGAREGNSDGTGLKVGAVGEAEVDGCIDGALDGGAS